MSPISNSPATEVGPISLTFGKVSEGDIKIGLATPAFPVGVQVRLQCLSGTKVLVVGDDDDSPVVTQDPGGAKCVLTVPAEHFAEPILGVSVHAADGAVLSRQQDSSYHLEKLFPTSEEGFRTSFNREVNRISDPETLAFAAQQVIQFYDLNPAHVCVALVIYGYRAIDMNSARMATRAAEWIERWLECDAPKMSFGGVTVRDNAAHLKISAGLVLWHLRLYLGSEPEFWQAVRLNCDQSQLYSKGHYTTPFNAFRPALIMGARYLLSGDIEKGTRHLGQIFLMHKWSLGFLGLETSSAHIRELREVHSAMYLAAKLREGSLNGGKGLPKIQEIYNSVCRVRNPEIKAAMQQTFSEFMLRKTRVITQRSM